MVSAGASHQHQHEMLLHQQLHGVDKHTAFWGRWNTHVNGDFSTAHSSVCTNVTAGTDSNISSVCCIANNS
jgi:hypothetical protein